MEKEKEKEKEIKGFYVCKACGMREAQSTYDCDVTIVCKACEDAIRAERAERGDVEWRN